LFQALAMPVIMITAYGNIETCLRSMNLGAFGFVNEPITKEEFERIARNALKKNDAEIQRGKMNLNNILVKGGKG
jgi:DNA-binding NtrC family response regulator